MALLLIELFVIPGFGIAGIAGIGLMLGSVFFVFRSAYKFETAVFTLSSAIILAFALAIALSYLLPRTRAWNHLVLSAAMDSGSGFHSAPREDFQVYVGTVSYTHLTLPTIYSV